MRDAVLGLCLMCAAASSVAAADVARPDPGNAGPVALVIHGGAGVIERGSIDPEREAAIHADLARALDAGYAVLDGGGSAVDAVQAAVLSLEESPAFNAGKGAVFNAEGGHELDASIMEGHTRRAGAVAAVTTVRNPIRLARTVMERSPHVMLIGAGAERFADDHPELERVPNDWFDTDARRRQYERALEREAARQAGLQEDRLEEAGLQADPGRYFGTVGAVALDARGHIAAATSTGGMTLKKWGRVGDSPIIGAGTWADERCGVSATGWGEFFIRNAVAHDICARVAYGGQRLQAAADEVILRVIPEHGGDGGIIAIDADGTIVTPFNTSGMYRGWINPDGSRGTAIFLDVPRDR